MRNLRASLGILTLTLLLWALPARATNFYVAPSGSDSNSGTQTQPFRTLQKAADVVEPGDNVYVANGTYKGFHLTRSGQPSARITFVALGNSVVVNENNDRNDHNINLEGASWVTVDGFISEDAPKVGLRAVLAQGVTFRNNTIRRAGLSGILTGWVTDLQIINNECANTVRQHGIYVSNSDSPDDNVVIRGNECYGNNNNGLQVNGDCWVGGDGIVQNVVIEDNIIRDNNWKGMSLISMQNSVVRNNIIYDNGISAGAGGIHLTDQVGPRCYKPSSNNIVCNNTIVEPRIAGIRMTDDATNNRIFNNLIVAQWNRLIVDEVGGNLIDSESNITLTSANGLFMNPGGHNYRLADQSQAIDAGVTAYLGANAPNDDYDANPRPAGPAVDVGAFEVATATAVGDTPAPLRLESVYPNPFNPTLTVAFTLDSTRDVSIRIYSASGQLVRTLASQEMSSGSHRVVWDGNSNVGERAASGVYLVQVTSGEWNVTRKVVMLK